MFFQSTLTSRSVVPWTRTKWVQPLIYTILIDDKAEQPCDQKYPYSTVKRYCSLKLYRDLKVFDSLSHDHVVLSFLSFLLVMSSLYSDFPSLSLQ
jgi:hypothetical protein